VARDRRRNPPKQVVAPEHVQSVGSGDEARYGRTRRDDLQRAADDVRQDERDNPRRREHARQSPALNTVEADPHRVDLVDGRSAREEEIGDSREVGQRDTVDGQREKRRTAAGEERESHVTP
jgi:hypothetical protein